jgi:hypothetical protein
MSYRYEFVSNVADGAISLPQDIASRLKAKGITRVRVVVESVADGESMLAERGIDAGVIERVAAAQSLDRDTATTALAGEGAAYGTPLGERLSELSDVARLNGERS